MYFKTIVKNITENPIQLGFIGRLAVRLDAGDTLEVPYEVMSACKHPTRLRSLKQSLELGSISLKYETDIPLQVVEEGSGETEPKPKKIKENSNTVINKQEDLDKAPIDAFLTEEQKDLRKQADEGSGIIEGAVDSIIPSVDVIIGEAPVKTPTVSLEDMLDGNISDTVEEVPAAKKKAPAKKKAAAKKKVVTLD
jgi:hypothetical protein